MSYGQVSEESFLIFYLVFLGMLAVILFYGAPMFAVPGVAEPPATPEHWYDWPGYLLGTVAFMLKLIIMPQIPGELKILSFLLFLPFILLLFWIFIRWIGPVIAQAIPF